MRSELRPSDTMTCDETEALLPLVADGVLDAEADPQLFAHLARCSQCQDSLAAHDLIELSLSASHPGRNTRPAVVRMPLPWWPALAAAAFLVAALGTWLWWPRPTPAVAPPALSATRIVAVQTDPGDGTPIYVVKTPTGEPVLIRHGSLDGQAVPERKRDIIPVSFDDGPPSRHRR